MLKLSVFCLVCVFLALVESFAGSNVEDRGPSVEIEHTEKICIASACGDTHESRSVVNCKNSKPRVWFARLLVIRLQQPGLRLPESECHR